MYFYPIQLWNVISLIILSSCPNKKTYRIKTICSFARVLCLTCLGVIMRVNSPMNPQKQHYRHSQCKSKRHNIVCIFDGLYCKMVMRIMMMPQYDLLPAAYSGQRVLSCPAPSVRPILVTTLQSTTFNGSSSYLVQPLTLVGARTLLVMGFLGSSDTLNFMNTLTDLPLGLGWPGVPVLRMVFLLLSRWFVACK